MDQVRMIHGSCHFSMGSTLRFSHFLPGGKDNFSQAFVSGKAATQSPGSIPGTYFAHTDLEIQETGLPFLMGKDRFFWQFLFRNCFPFSFEHMEGWKHPSFKPHEKNDPRLFQLQPRGCENQRKHHCS